MNSRFVRRAIGFAVLLAFAGALMALSSIPIGANTDPWAPSQIVQPAALTRELENPDAAPMVVFAGFARLYTAGHIKGAQYHGTTGKEDGLKQFTAWASSQPRTSNIVIYCGCCPMERCPNIRPAFKVLEDLGFKQVRVLLLPNDFATDWADKGLPYDRGN